MFGIPLALGARVLRILDDYGPSCSHTIGGGGRSGSLLETLTRGKLGSKANNISAPSDEDPAWSNVASETSYWCNWRKTSEITGAIYGHAYAHA